MFAAAAPKCYLYSTQNEETGEIGQDLQFKVKGITLNCRNLETVNPQAILETILETPNRILAVETPSKICRNMQTATLSVRSEKKTWKISFDKRIVNWGIYTTLPWGYKA